METTVYIQSENKFPFDDWACTAYLGFRDQGANIKLYEDINNVPLNKYTMVIGCIEDTVKWFKDAGIIMPKPMTMPEELRKYANREINVTTIEIAKEITKFPFFIKPYSKLKGFYPEIIKDEKMCEHFWSFMTNTSNDDLVLISEVAPMDSEYRCYVVDGKLIGVCNYLGDFRLYPDIFKVEQMIADYTTAPRAYSIDVAVQKDSGETILIECNDGWSLGNYGLSPKQYVRLLTTRWREIITKK